MPLQVKELADENKLMALQVKELADEVEQYKRSKAPLADEVTELQEKVKLAESVIDALKQRQVQRVLPNNASYKSVVRSKGHRKLLRFSVRNISE
eukprot:COSAG02_NODE_10061_length_2035_cov_13.276860_4_plen_95_part_00